MVQKVTVMTLYQEEVLVALRSSDRPYPEHLKVISTCSHYEQKESERKMHKEKKKKPGRNEPQKKKRKRAYGTRGKLERRKHTFCDVMESLRSCLCKLNT